MIISSTNKGLAAIPPPCFIQSQGPFFCLDLQYLACGVSEWLENTEQLLRNIVNVLRLISVDNWFVKECQKTHSSWYLTKVPRDLRTPALLVIPVSLMTWADARCHGLSRKSSASGSGQLGIYRFCLFTGFLMGKKKNLTTQPATSPSAFEGKAA